MLFRLILRRYLHRWKFLAVVFAGMLLSSSTMSGSLMYFDSLRDIALDFELNKDPAYLYLRVDRTDSWKPYKQLVKFVYANNKGEFKKGKNSIVIKRNETSGFRKLLADAIFKDDYVTIMMAASQNRTTWGGVSSERLILKATPVAPLVLKPKKEKTYSEVILNSILMD